MLFNSYVFILAFLPITILGYAAFSRWTPRRAALAWLVLCSLVYYGWWEARYLQLILLSIVFNYGTGRVLAQDRPQGVRRGLLAAGVLFNLGLLGYFKYANFLVDSFTALTGVSFTLDKIILPLAISFFTFQQIAYLVDAYRDRAHESRFIDYCLFVTFFPQLIAGPIVHHSEMMPQFARRKRYRFNARDLSIGLTIFTIGLAKKVIIADTVAQLATPVFSAAGDGTAPSFAGAWIATFAYSFQIYFDFSGYSDMAIGLGRIFGIKLPINFNSPYKAYNIIEFWRRWHITLSRFLRDYLYIGLGGNRLGKRRRYINLLVTMLLGGLWHGAGWTFVFWGGLHGTYLMINHAWRAARHVPRADQPPATRAGRFAGCVVTYLAVCLAWVFFRAESFHAAGLMLGSMAGLNGFAGPLGSSLETIEIVAVVLPVIVWLLPNTQQIMGRVRPALGTERQDIPTRAWWQWRPTTCHAWGTLALLLYTVFAIATKTTEFIYYQF